MLAVENHERLIEESIEKNTPPPRYAPNLIAVPANAVSTWRHEIATYFPTELSVKFFAGTSTTGPVQIRTSTLGTKATDLARCLSNEDMTDPNITKLVIITTHTTAHKRLLQLTDRGIQVVEAAHKRKKTAHAQTSRQALLALYNDDEKDPDLDADDEEEDLGGFDRDCVELRVPSIAKKFGLMFIDEAHRLRSPSTRTFLTFDLLQAQNTFFVSATLSLNLVKDMVGALTFFFLDRYEEFEGLRQAAIQSAATPEEADLYSYVVNGTIDYAKAYKCIKAVLTSRNIAQSISPFLSILDPQQFGDNVKGVGTEATAGAAETLPAILSLLQFRRTMADTIDDVLDENGQPTQISGDLAPFLCSFVELTPSHYQEESIYKLQQELSGSYVSGFNEVAQAPSLNTQTVRRFVQATAHPKSEQFYKKGLTNAKQVSELYGNVDNGATLFYRMVTKDHNPPAHRDRKTAALYMANNSAKLSFLAGIIADV